MAPMFAGAAIANVADLASISAVPFSVALLVGSLILLLGSYTIAKAAYKRKRIV